ncbi:hypothetical protein K7X08_004976 [Anisodus acutangulus]|uniref:Protein kinase domain-containing protein n=1 Tax=Anisodus acutangulus TaxID=402998 RepID=A0A9Q1RJ04_9SOLA|nr:hypothetical protein K7X08_004976 [Anisodus acutangulus]
MNLLTIFLLFLFYCYIGFANGVVTKTELRDEVSILLSIKESLVDPLDQLRDWTVPKNAVAGNISVPCSWKGVECNSDGAVEKLDLSHMNLTGKVSDDIQKLNSLTSLNLCCNGFSSPLPRSFSNLTALKSIDVSQNYFVYGFPVGLGMSPGLMYLNASSNNFSGYLPEDIGNATFLETLDFRGNFFEGSIPKSYKNLGKLKFLGLSGNNLTGHVPGELGELSSLESIVLGYNSFEGGIPNEFGNLTNLKYLDLAVGNLGGPIPSELGKLKLLDTVFLYKNNLEGKIPPEIGNITSLQLLDLSDNMLTGEIPAKIAELENLQLLNLMSNKLSGSVPPGIGGLPQLEVFELWNNSLSGPLPSDLGRNSPLQWVDISSNSFTGPIPAGLCIRGNLTKLILFNNTFSGPIPAGLSTCMSLVRVRMQNNLLSGMIPAGFGKLGKLQRLELANNSLTGQIPSDLASSTSLSFIDFSKNHIQSSIPSSILAIPTLQNFIASDNNLVGKIPDQFQDCPSLSVLDLSTNQFTGDLPASIASCEKLVTLNLRNNQLNGPIPRVISMMPTLAVLDLSNNSFTGGIPENFGNSPALEMLNVSHNKLEGPVPANGMLRTINPDDLIGNAGLCGGVLPPCAHNAAYTSKQKILHAKHIIAGWLTGVAALLLIVTAGLGAKSLYKRWHENGGCFERRFEMSSGDWPWRLMAFQRLGLTSNDILACLKESNVIGMGATGVVYKAEVQRQNTVVAVKKLWKSATDIEMGGSEDLVGEVNVLGNLRHRNIVRLLGFLHNNRDAMIIYEYMQNGSLGEALHEARIADFGLARMMLKKNETVSMVAGSYGYIAPEYGYTLKVDEKSDIYSYGVVLMELLTGKRPLDPEFGESVDIVEWFRMKIRDNKSLEAALDPNVGATQHVQEEMLLVLRIAILCIAKLPKDRPSMRDVLTMLKEAKPRRKSSSNSGGSHAATNKDKPIFSTSPVNGLL